MNPPSHPRDPAPATAQGEDVRDWRRSDYEDDPEITGSGNPCTNNTHQHEINHDDLFGDLEDDESEQFAPGGLMDDMQSPSDPFIEQTSDMPMSIAWDPQHKDHVAPSNHHPFPHDTSGGQVNLYGGPSVPIPSAREWPEDESFNSGYEELESPDLGLPQFSRKESLKPDAPYSGYARNSNPTEPRYQGASDISRPRAWSTNIDEQFSDVDDVSEKPRTSPNRPESPQTEAPKKCESVFFELAPDDYVEIDRSRYPELYANRPPSPSESQLEREGFEFHNGLSEEEVIARFSQEAVREQIQYYEGAVSRKPQWTAYQYVLQDIERKQKAAEEKADQGEGYDPLKPQRDFPAESSSSHHGCQCGGDADRCDCAPGKCGCARCPRNHWAEQRKSHSGSQSHGHAHQATVENEQDDAPMDIGLTPITPGFPNVYDQHGIHRIPGLGQLAEETENEDQPRRKSSQKQKHRCSCGDDCQCPQGQCKCPDLDAEEPTQIHRCQGCGDNCQCPRLDGSEAPQYHQDRLAKEPLGWLIKKAAEHPESSNRQDRAAPTPPQQGLDQVNPSSSVHERPYYTPQQGFSFVHSAHSSQASTPAAETPPQIPPSRPDTPRPHDADVRESVEPEMPLPNWHRDSTPAYTDRSGSPSPVSRSPMSRHSGDRESPNEMDRIDGIDDITMRDITPVPGSRAFHRSREESMAPNSPTHFSRSRLSVPRTSSPTMASSPTRHLMPSARSPRSDSVSRPSSPLRMPDHTPTASQHPIPAPPIPTSTAPGLKTTKQRGKRKSAVQGSKVAKSRNVTAKQTRKATVKHAKDADDGENKKGGKVKEAVARIEDSLGQGTPQRRSTRIRERVDSGSPGPDYRGQGG